MLDFRPHPRWLTIGVLVLAAALRWWAIEIKPAHFDEGINGWFADQMELTGYYKYDPTNYHGPLHFYAVFFCKKLFGRSLWALRLPAVLAGIAGVWLLLRAKPYFGATGSLLAALAMAVSPAFVFYGRYSIHESWLVLFNLMFFLGLLGLWRRGSARDLALAIAGAAGMVLSKETYIIQIGCAALAWLFLWLWNFVVPGEGGLRFARRQWKPSQFALYLGLAVVLVVFFYSGTFCDWAGVAGIGKALAAWFCTGVEEGGHAKTGYDLVGPLNWYWIALMVRYEWPALLGLAACAACLPKCGQTLRFTAIYAGGLLLAYSVVSYKTPWCIIALLWPFYLVGGGVIERMGGRWRLWAAAAWLAAVAVSYASSLRLNFRNFTDPAEPYVYVQTDPEISVLTGPILEKARRDPANYGLRGMVLLESYYPVPWILGDFPQVGYYGNKEWPVALDADFLVAPKEKLGEVREKAGEGFVVYEFRLRDAQEPCVVFFRREVFQDVLPPAP